MYTSPCSCFWARSLNSSFSFSSVKARFRHGSASSVDRSELGACDGGSFELATEEFSSSEFTVDWLKTVGGNICLRSMRYAVKRVHVEPMGIRGFRKHANMIRIALVVYVGALR